MFLKIELNSQENTCAVVEFLFNKVYVTYLIKQLNLQLLIALSWLTFIIVNDAFTTYKLKCFTYPE